MTSRGKHAYPSTADCDVQFIVDKRGESVPYEWSKEDERDSGEVDVVVFFELVRTRGSVLLSSYLREGQLGRT